MFRRNVRALSGIASGARGERRACVGITDRDK
jgi:hypothetical protein